MIVRGGSEDERILLLVVSHETPPFSLWTTRLFCETPPFGSLLCDWFQVICDDRGHVRC